MKLDPSIISLNDYENTNMIRLKLARYSTAQKALSINVSEQYAVWPFSTGHSSLLEAFGSTHNFAPQLLWITLVHSQHDGQRLQVLLVLFTTWHPTKGKPTIQIFFFQKAILPQYLSFTKINFDFFWIPEILYFFFSSSSHFKHFLSGTCIFFHFGTYFFFGHLDFFLSWFFLLSPILHLTFFFSHLKKLCEC